jgi:hypothetical protein
MPTQPRIVERPEQPYVAISGQVTMQTVGAIADRLPEVFVWLADHGLEPAGPPFFRYTRIDMQRQLEIEAGVPVAAAAKGDRQVNAGAAGWRSTTPTPPRNPTCASGRPSWRSGSPASPATPRSAVEGGACQVAELVVADAGGVAGP